jgi:prepilin-type N-terminal cleavage/methylation domain-containing protein
MISPSRKVRFVTLRHHGFSLIELAIVLVVITILLTTIGLPIAAQVEQRRREETIRQLEVIREAIIGFAMARGRLPCPARIADNGQESLKSNDEVYGDCEVYRGYVPAATLGITPIDSNGFSIDSWGGSANRILYAVRNLTTVAGGACMTVPVDRPFTKKGGMRQAGMGCLAAYDKDVAGKALITICAKTPNAAQPFCNPTGLTANAPFVIISLGKNAAVGGQLGTDEAWNAGNAGDGTVFVSRTPSSVGSPGGEFDDIVIWGSLNTLFARMVQAGQLP